MAKTELKGQKIKDKVTCKDHKVCCGYNGRIVEIYTMEQALEKIDEYLDSLADEYADGEYDIADLDDDLVIDEIQTDIENEFTYFNCCPECGAELNKWWVRGSLRKCLDRKLDDFEYTCQNRIAEKLNQNLDNEYQRRFASNE